MIPKVSVIIPNYNHGRFLDARIRSVLNQTLRDIEVVFLDDASTDDSLNVLRKYRRDPRLRLVCNETNSGNPFLQWNKGVDLARGEYTWIAESDDCADAHFLSTMVSCLDRNPAASVAYSNSWLIDDNDNIIGSMNRFYSNLPDSWRWLYDYVNSGDAECAQYLSIMNTIPNASAVVFRRERYLRIGGADPALRLCGDWLLWARMLMASHVAFVSQHLNRFRMHSGNVRTSSRQDGTDVKEAYVVVAEILRRVTVSDRQHRRSCLALAGLWANSSMAHSIPRDDMALIGELARSLDTHLAAHVWAQILLCLIGRVVGRRSFLVSRAFGLLRHASPVAAIGPAGRLRGRQCKRDANPLTVGIRRPETERGKWIHE